MQRVYRFEVVEARYRAPDNALFRARDSANGSMVTLCEWTPRNSKPAVDSEKLDQAADALDGAEFFSAGPSFYLAARDDPSATAALERFRSQGWFSGQWPGLIATPVAAKSEEKRPAASVAWPKVKTVAPTPTLGRNWVGIAMMVGVAFAAGIVVMVVLSKNADNPRSATSELKPAAIAPVESAPNPEQPLVSQPPKPDLTQPPTPSASETSQPPAASQDVPEPILKVLEEWRTTMLNNDPDGQADCYAPFVELFFRRKNLDRETLRKMVRGGMSTWPHVDHYEISSFAFDPIRDDRAAITFHKHWDSWDAPRVKHFAGEETERLTFEKVTGEWKIVREEELKIDWVKKDRD
jgi:hypothetical protein